MVINVDGIKPGNFIYTNYLWYDRYFSLPESFEVVFNNNEIVITPSGEWLLIYCDKFIGALGIHELSKRSQRDFVNICRYDNVKKIKIDKISALQCNFAWVKIDDILSIKNIND